MRKATALLLLALLPVGCRTAPRDSPEFREAFELYTQLYSASLEDAYGDARMQDVVALLRRVDPGSAQATESRELLDKIEEAIAQRTARAERLAAALQASDAPIELDREFDRPLDRSDGGGAPGHSLPRRETAAPIQPASPSGESAAQDTSPPDQAGLDTPAAHEGSVTVKAENPSADADVIPLVRAAAARALPAAFQWGALRQDTVIDIISNRDSLQIRGHFEGAEWVDAVAAYDVVYLLSPHEMAQPGSLPSAARLTRLLAHELTHCVLQQATGTAETYRGRGIPFWFNEGMATNAARNSVALSRAELAVKLSSRPAIDPLREGRRLAHGEPALAYSTAYWAFQLLEERGIAPIQHMLRTMHGGATFPEAFGRVYGEPQAAVEERLLKALRRNEPFH